MQAAFWGVSCLCLLYSGSLGLQVVSAFNSTPFLYSEKLGSVCKNEGERSQSIALVLYLKTRHFHEYKNKTMTRHRPWAAWA